MTDKQENNDVPLNIRIGIDQEMFFFNKVSPGSCFWLPNGTRLYNNLMNFIKNEYYKRDYKEVKSPVIAKKDLWEISGHWSKYKENMFCFKCDDTEYATKAMNCPLHCVMFSSSTKSYKDLPLRLADLGPLHRNENRNSLTSLFRNRLFTQDDSHIFCMFDQIEQEIDGVIDFIKYVYDKFGFEFEVNLSTRPDEYIGELENWDNAEAILKKVLDSHNFKWNLNEKDGAFYGPKIDITLTDSLKRKHQCATIQLDFNLPIKFDLKYMDKDNKLQTPVMIHRAIYGSFERFIAILSEHYNGKWPLWLAHSPIVIVPINAKVLPYAEKVKEALMQTKLNIDIDKTDLIVSNKIKNAKLKLYNYIVVVGQKECDNNTVAIRCRDSDEIKVMSIDDLLKDIDTNIKNFK